MSVSLSADSPNEMSIAVHEHISGYANLEATWDFPGDVEVTYFGLTLTAATETGTGNVYLTATSYDDEELSVVIAVDVVGPFRPLRPVGLRCAGETDDEFVVAWRFQEHQQGFPQATGIDYEITGPGLDQEGQRFLGNAYDKFEDQIEFVSGLRAGSQYRLRLRTYHWKIWGAGGVDEPKSTSDWVSISCSTQARGYTPPSPELTHVHLYQGILVDSFAQGGRSLRVPTSENVHGEPWRVPLILGKETTVAAEVLFDEWNPDVQINGQDVLPNRRRVEVDDDSGRLLATFARTFAEAPGSIEVATGGVTRTQIRHDDFKVGTTEVPAWTALLVPVNTPVRTVVVGELTKRWVREDLLGTWPFGKLEMKTGDPLSTSTHCEDDSTKILRELADSISAPPRTLVVGLVGQPSNGRPVCVSETTGWFISALAFQGRPYVLARCTKHADGCLPHHDVTHAFGHTAGLPHVEELEGCEDCEFEAFPYRGALVAPFLGAPPGRDSPVNLDWVHAPLFWWKGLVYGARNPNGESRASGSWRRYLLYQDIMSAGYGTSSRWSHGALRSTYPSDHTYRVMLDHLRAGRTAESTDVIVD